MRSWACTVALALVLSSCAGFVDGTVPEAVRDVTHTMGSESVRTDLETLALSDEVHRILTELTQELIASGAGAMRGPEVEASLRELISLAIRQIRSELSDVPPALDQAMDDLLVDAENMVTRIVSRTLREVRGMVHGDDVSHWARALLHHVLRDLIDMASNALGDDSAERIGTWMRTAFRTVLADVDVEQGAERVARAAARGFGNGLGDSLDGELGEVLHREREALVISLRDGSQDAARPWIVASTILLVAAAVLAILWFRTHRDHSATISELQRNGDRPAREVLRATRARGVRLAQNADAPLPPNDGPSE